MTLAGATEPAMVVEGVTERHVFEAYVERFLEPSLRAGQIVLLDNLGAHKTERVREAKGCGGWFLPSYSPDMNPLEEAFSKMKALLEGRPDEGGPHRGDRRGFGDRDARGRGVGWFAHSGYGTQRLPL